MSTPDIRVCGLSKDVTLAILPRLYLAELLLELSRRNISTEYSSREHLVTLLRDVMEYEYRSSVSDSVQKPVDCSTYRQQRTHFPMPSKYQTENEIHRPQQFGNEPTFPSAYAQTMSSIWSPPAPVTAYNSTSTENATNKSMRGEYTNFSIFPTFTATRTSALTCRTQDNINVSTKQACQTDQEVVSVKASPSNEGENTWDPAEENVSHQLNPIHNNTAVTDEIKSSPSDSETSKQLKQDKDGTSEDALNKKPCETSSTSGRRRRARKKTPTKRETRKRRKKLKVEEVYSSDEDPDVTVTPIVIRKSRQDSLEGGADEDCSYKRPLYRCPQCEYATRVKINVQNHIRTHTGEKPFKCTECNYSASQKVHLDSHMTRHTGERSYMCEECGYRTAFRCSLVRHRKTHTGEKPYVCNLCSYRAIRRTHLVNHMRTHTGEKPFMCEECGHMTADKTSLIRHKKNHTTDRN